MKSIDIKSLLIGILGTALVVVPIMSLLTPKYQLSCGTNCMLLNTSTGVVKSIQLPYLASDINDSNSNQLGTEPNF